MSQPVPDCPCMTTDGSVKSVITFVGTFTGCKNIAKSNTVGSTNNSEGATAVRSNGTAAIACGR